MPRGKSETVQRREEMTNIFRQLEPTGQAFALRYAEKLLELQKLDEIASRVEQNRASEKEACSFCGKEKEGVSRLLAGPAGVYICEDCVKLCSELLADDEKAGANE